MLDDVPGGLSPLLRPPTGADWSTAALTAPTAPDPVPVHVRFHGQSCRAILDAPTRRALERSLRELAFGRYLETRPGH